MLLKHWAKNQGICYHTALRWFHSGKLPVPAIQSKSGSILVGDLLPIQKKDDKFAIYARVSSHDQKADLGRQLDRLRDYCASNGLIVSKEVAEIGSGLNGNRPKLITLLRSSFNLVVENPDRLSRFGVPYIEALLEQSNRKLIIVNATESKMDLVQDFIDVVTSMCARIYGKRSASNRAKRAVEAASQ